jgi:hypothetical protein
LRPPRRSKVEAGKVVEPFGKTALLEVKKEIAAGGRRNF